MFDAKPPKDMANALPGGNALVFDWELLRQKNWPLPWMLSGGLKPENLAEAVKISRAEAVDVSSGVERKPGEKDPAKIRAFLARAQAL
jgi:phosphoribosylanthranilate isomerase